MTDEAPPIAEDPDAPLTAEDVARVDAEGDEPQGDTPEGDVPPPEPAQPASDMIAEDTFRKLEAAAKAHRTKVANILGDESYGLIECPLCIASIVPGMVNLADAGNLHPEHEAIVKHYLGISREMEYAQDDQVSECPVCHGEGKTKTDKVEVTVGARNDRDVEIVKGLSDGDRVLVKPASASDNETKL